MKTIKHTGRPGDRSLNPILISILSLLLLAVSPVFAGGGGGHHGHFHNGHGWSGLGSHGHGQGHPGSPAFDVAVTGGSCNTVEITASRNIKRVTVLEVSDSTRYRSINALMTTVTINPVTVTGLIVKLSGRHGGRRHDLTSDLEAAMASCMSVPECPLTPAEQDLTSNLIANSSPFTDTAEFCSGSGPDELSFFMESGAIFGAPILRVFDLSTNQADNGVIEYFEPDISADEVRACAAVLGCPLLAAGP